jgi:hypothetical protein
MAMKLNTTPQALNESADERVALIEQLRVAGLMEFPELDAVNTRREVGAGQLPQIPDMLSPMVSSVPQADR